MKNGYLRENTHFFMVKWPKKAKNGRKIVKSGQAKGQIQQKKLTERKWEVVQQQFSKNPNQYFKITPQPRHPPNKNKCQRLSNEIQFRLL
ncbi:hypothetical protein J2T02_000543 [Chitinophaga terrae (ex Kim and Jung 2007)]|uniref:hypothetical protein n=1 Tax=Chitinophaga terrae (ex Kim and Jung 2007) TaxID=408074 RepID=UPI00278A0CE5|nr:hypothetical protein [Chitinophaga terrae (ex Kim and Jung 2007)]MDQ0105450.1 hypothetical protein [Chitinophaga terrae (ex Kim and Jung 2007)]